MELINKVGDLADVASVLGVRTDWHEPDEQGVTARLEGDHLDNASGARGVAGEFVVVLSKDGEDVAQVNLATLLAWATAAGRHATGRKVDWSSYLMRS